MAMPQNGLLSTFAGAAENPISEGGNWATQSYPSGPNGFRRDGTGLAKVTSSGTLNSASTWVGSTFGSSLEVYAAIAAWDTGGQNTPGQQFVVTMGMASASDQKFYEFGIGGAGSIGLPNFAPNHTSYFRRVNAGAVVWTSSVNFPFNSNTTGPAIGDYLAMRAYVMPWWPAAYLVEAWMTYNGKWWRVGAFTEPAAGRLTGGCVGLFGRWQTVAAIGFDAIGAGSITPPANYSVNADMTGFSGVTSDGLSDPAASMAGFHAGNLAGVVGDVLSDRLRQAESHLSHAGGGAGASLY